jgi:hypothetical protein
MGFEIDTSTAFGADVIRRLDDQKLAWLTTVDSTGTPQPNPVRFQPGPRRPVNHGTGLGATPGQCNEGALDAPLSLFTP